MFRVSTVLSIAVACGSLLSAARGQSVDDQLIPRTTAQRHGLRQAWFAQVEVDPASGHVSYITKDSGMLLVQTTNAMVHTLDAETGRTLWAVQIGRKSALSLAPAANDKYVAVINGTTLFIVDRKNGRLKWDRELTSVPGAGPVMSTTHVFVPMVSGLVEAYQLEKPEARPWTYRSAGRILTQPIITAHSISWTTDRGHFYVASIDKVEIQLRLETGAAIEARPAYWTPFIYATSLDGNVYAIDETEGETQWRFSTGNPISQPPVAINGVVYASSEGGGMYQLDGTKGHERWYAPAVTRFLAASPTRIYASDRYNRMVVLDIKTGAMLESMPMGAVTFRVINRETDRIYLCTRTGQLQCLHEFGLRMPVKYQPPTAESLEKKAPADPKKDAKEAGEEEPAEGKEEEPQEEEEEKEAPAPGGEAAESDPFG